MTAKGKNRKKERRVPLPLWIIPEISRQFDMLKKEHQQDLEKGTCGVLLFDSIEKKIGARNFTGNNLKVRNWGFPAKKSLITVSAIVLRVLPFRVPIFLKRAMLSEQSKNL